MNTMNYNLTHSKKPSELTISETEMVSGGCPPCIAPAVVAGAKFVGGAVVVGFAAAAGAAAWKKVSSWF